MLNSITEVAVSNADGADLSLKERRRSLLALLLFAAVLLLGLLMRADGEHAVLVGLEGPHCVLRGLLGEKACPGCGLTRSVVLVLHGGWGEAWDVHPAGFLVAALCLAGLIVHGSILFGRRRTEWHGRLLSLGYRIFVVGLLLSWLWRVF